MLAERHPGCITPLFSRQLDETLCTNQLSPLNQWLWFDGLSILQRSSHLDIVEISKFLVIFQNY